LLLRAHREGLDATMFAIHWQSKHQKEGINNPTFDAYDVEAKFRELRPRSTRYLHTVTKKKSAPPKRSRSAKLVRAQLLWRWLALLPFTDLVCVLGLRPHGENAATPPPPREAAAAVSSAARTRAKSSESSGRRFGFWRRINGGMALLCCRMFVVAGRLHNRSRRVLQVTEWLESRLESAAAVDETGLMASN
jgi:hypothetical protein